jgi:hypothetical protein
LLGRPGYSATHFVEVVEADLDFFERVSEFIFDDKPLGAAYRFESGEEFLPVDCSFADGGLCN